MKKRLIFAASVLVVAALLAMTTLIARGRHDSDPQVRIVSALRPGSHTFYFGLAKVPPAYSESRGGVPGYGFDARVGQNPAERLFALLLPARHYWVKDDTQEPAGCVLTMRVGDGVVWKARVAPLPPSP